MDWIRELPLVPSIGVLWVIVLCRAGGTYALGRAAHRLAHRGRVAELLDAPRVARAIGLIQRWGAPVVAVSFLTVGFQTAANAAAGLTRMPLVRYLPALVVGGFVWACIYATIGLAAVALWVELFLTSPWAAVALLVIVAAIVVAVLVRRRRRRRRAARETPVDTETIDTETIDETPVRPSEPAPERR